MHNEVTPEVLENRKKWVAALRSGNYQQGKGKLCRNDKFCCLGVAADLFSSTPFYVNNGGTRVYTGDFFAVLPPDVREAIGLDHVGSIPKDIEGCYNLWTLNDYAEYSFDQIADVIEEQLIKPFGG